MAGLKIDMQNGVYIAGCTISLLGTRLETYVYLVDGLAVDTGPSKFRREYAEFFEAHRPESAVITHFHEDHSGNAPWLEKQGIETFIDQKAIPLCIKKAKIPFYRRIFWGSRSQFSPKPLGNYINGRTRAFQILEVPGHSFDHIALYDPDQGAIYTGDLFVTPKTKIIMKNENIYQIMDSLKLILKYDFQTVYCAHAGVVHNGRELFKNKLEHLGALIGKVQGLKKKGLSVKEINRRVFPRTAPLTYVSGGEWSSEHIIRSILADR